MTGLPSRVNEIASAILKVLPEIREKMIDRIRSPLPEPADRCVSHNSFKIAYRRFIHGPGSREQSGQLGRAFAARGALSAAFIPEEFQKIERRGFHSVVV